MGIFDLLFSFFSESKKKELSSRRVDPPLEAFQIGVSSICNLKCIFCPTSYTRVSKKDALLSLDLYKKLLPYFPWAKWVYLQGWGEPLLNPDIWEMALIAKEAGNKVGLTTNGTLLDDQAIEQIFANKLDLISISIAGASAETHASLRVGSDLEQITRAIKKIIKIREEKGLDYPFVTLSYMLTHKTIKELPEAVEIFHKLGVDDFYTTNLDYVFNELTKENKIFTYFKDPNPKYEEYIAQAQKYANKHSFEFRTYPLQVKDKLRVCDLDPNRFIFITSNGDVTPCTYLAMEENPRYFDDQYDCFPRKVFGNIADNSLDEIWHKEIYRNFRAPFLIRTQAFNDFAKNLIISKPTSISQLKSVEEEYDDALKKNPVPVECQTCHKIYGV